MPAKTFDLEHVGTIHVYKRRGTKNIRLSVNADGKIRVTMPTWLPYKAGVAFAAQKQNWLLSHQDKTSNLEDGQRIGKYHTFRFSVKSGSKVQTRVTATEILISYPTAASTTEIQNGAHSAAQRALKTEAEQLLPQRLASLSAKTGFTYKSVGVRHLKARWGSCNNKQEITLNYYLMQLPWELIDYVLVHELAHTKHLHHATVFWDTVESVMPNYKERKKLLKQHQPSVLTPKSTRSM